MNNNLSVPQIIILASGGVMLIGSFLDFFSGENAWSGGLIFVLAAFLGIAMAVVVALTAFANVKLPERVLTLSWTQIHLALAVYAALLMLSWLLLKTGGSVDRGIGFWLMFLAAAGLVAGAVMLRNEAPATGGGPAAPPTSF